MKRHIKIAFIYAIAAMVYVVFYREFTKGMCFDGVTALGKVHTHLFMQGAAISGVSGIAHVVTAAGLVLFFVMLIQTARAEERTKESGENKD